MIATETLHAEPYKSTAQGAGLAYWLCQLGGWGAIAMVNVSFSLGNTPEVRDPLVLISVWGGLCGVTLSHGWRRYLRQHRVFAPSQPLSLGRIAVGLVVLTAAQVSLVFGALLLWPQRPDAGSFAWLPSVVAF